MSLSAYLAKNYLTASGTSHDPSDLSTRPKKRRRKDKSATETNASLIIADDEDLLLSGRQNLISQDDDAPALDSTFQSGEFRKAKKNNWKVVGSAAPNNADVDAADEILAEAARLSDARRLVNDVEDAPALVEEEEGPALRMDNGARAGLQTAADTEAMAAAQEKNKSEERRRHKKAKEIEKAPEETIYRDATGRRIDVSMKRAEARATEEEKRRQEKKDREDAMGEIQLREREQRKEDLDEAKFLGVARYADDKKLNVELREQVRWDDPMAEYMAQKQAEERPRTRTGSSKPAGPRKKVYQGAAPPNRYGIRPGWRWDGVDRSNGFEQQWFQARGRKARNENLEYQWQMDE